MGRYEEKCHREVFENYVAESLRAISESTAKFAGGSYIKQKYSDMIKPKPKEKKSGKEIADNIIKKITRR